VKGRVPADEAAQCLQRLETLLDQALDDLVGRETLAPCSRFSELLERAFAELQEFSRLLNDCLPDRTNFSCELRSVLPRLSAAQRLLSAASDFYRGWCAAGLEPGSSGPGYQADCQTRGPVLLAVEG